MTFKEIHPDNDDKRNHLVIYEVKSEKILGFEISDDGQEFFYIDDSKTINRLVRMKDSKNLTEFANYKIKDMDIPHFNESGYFP